ncbi:MAG: hypothetical protein CBD16_03105 [Betaproteobacteria bacterium TMED156]|nr:MAG: hypothetical protein CBD16_03105 [Betaproteobacteria bacterium TMED156]
MNLIDTFKYLVALEQHKHFSRAARACHITQPALSNAIKALEDELNIKIVNRGRIYQGLTDEGKRVLSTAYNVLNETEALKQDVNFRKGNPSGKFTLGCVPSALPVATRFAVLLSENFSEITPSVRSMASHEIELNFENHLIDLAFGYVDRFELTSTEHNIKHQYFEKYFLVKALDKTHEKTEFLDEISWQSASKEKLCLLTSEMYNRVLVNQFFKTIDIEIKPTLETDSIFSLLLSVQKSAFSTILPGPVAHVANKYDGLKISRLINPKTETSMGLLIPSNKHLTILQEKALEIATDPSWEVELKLMTIP